MSTAETTPESETDRHVFEDDGSSAHGNRVMLGALMACVTASVTSIVVAGVTGATWVLVIGVIVMGVSVAAMLSQLNGLIGTEHETYGEA
jgi:hypothetical protein